MEDCAFSREEAEVLMTYTHTGMSRDEGDHLLRWARNQAYRSNRIRFASMRNLCAVISKRYHPEGIKSVNFWEPKDGKQHLVLYHRSLIGVLQRLLRHPRYAGVQYTSFRMLRTDQGVRVFGGARRCERCAQRGQSVDAKGVPSVAKVCQTCGKVWAKSLNSTLWVACFGRCGTVWPVWQNVCKVWLSVSQVWV